MFSSYCDSFPFPNVISGRIRISMLLSSTMLQYGYRSGIPTCQLRPPKNESTLMFIFSSSEGGEAGCRRPRESTARLTSPLPPYCSHSNSSQLFLVLSHLFTLWSARRCWLCGYLANWLESWPLQEFKGHFLQYQPSFFLIFYFIGGFDWTRLHSGSLPNYCKRSC